MTKYFYPLVKLFENLKIMLKQYETYDVLDEAFIKETREFFKLIDITDDEFISYDDVIKLFDPVKKGNWLCCGNFSINLMSKGIRYNKKLQHKSGELDKINIDITFLKKWNLKYIMLLMYLLDNLVEIETKN